MTQVLYGDIGSVKAALKGLMLGPDLEHRLVEVEARFADGLALPRPTDEQVKTSETFGIPGQFPQFEICGEDSAHDESVEYADKNGHRIAIVGWFNGDDEESVTKVAERWMLALRKMLRTESLMPMIGCFPIPKIDAQYGVVGKKANVARPYVKGASVNFVVTTIE